MFLDPPERRHVAGGGQSRALYRSARVHIWHVCAHTHTARVACAPPRARAGTMPGARSALSTRILAVKCFFMAAGVASTAYQLMRGEDPSIQLDYPSVFIARWAANFLARGDVHDAPPPGRPRAIPDFQAQACAVLFRDGLYAGGVLRSPYRNWDEACDHNSYFGYIAEKYGVKKKTLWAAMQPWLADLVRVQPQIKWAFTIAERVARVVSAVQLLARAHEMASWIYVDEAWCWVDHKTREWVWAVRSAERPEIYFQRKAAKSTRRLKFFVGVNSQQGLVGLFFTTGTTGMEHTHYTVRRAANVLGCLPASK